MAMFEGIIRREMKRRVDEVLNAGKEWNRTADKLADAINRAVEKGDAKTVKELSSTGKKLQKPTIRLAKAFENYTKTLGKIAVNI